MYKLEVLGRWKWVLIILCWCFDHGSGLKGKINGLVMASVLLSWVWPLWANRVNCQRWTSGEDWVETREGFTGRLCWTLSRQSELPDRQTVVLTLANITRDLSSQGDVGPHQRQRLPRTHPGAAGDRRGHRHPDRGLLRLPPRRGHGLQVEQEEVRDPQRGRKYR